MGNENQQKQKYHNSQVAYDCQLPTQGQFQNPDSNPPPPKGHVPLLHNHLHSSHFSQTPPSITISFPFSGIRDAQNIRLHGYVQIHIQNLLKNNQIFGLGYNQVHFIFLARFWISIFYNRINFKNIWIHFHNQAHLTAGMSKECENLHLRGQ